MSLLEFFQTLGVVILFVLVLMIARRVDRLSRR